MRLGALRRLGGDWTSSEARHWEYGTGSIRGAEARGKGGIVRPSTPRGIRGVPVEYHDPRNALKNGDSRALVGLTPIPLPG